MSDRLLSAVRAGPQRAPMTRRIAKSRWLWLAAAAGVIFLVVQYGVPDEPPPPPPNAERGTMPNISYDQPVAPVNVRAPTIVTAAVASPVKPAEAQPAVVESYPRITLEARSYSKNGYVPEYLKPAQAAAEANTKREVERVAYKEGKFPTIRSWTDPDRTYKLSRFTTIPCVLETSVITGVSGVTPFRCHIHTPNGKGVRSPADVVLFDEGTVVGGFYKSNVSEGDKRVVMGTAQAETPFGVKVAFGDMPVADMLGAGGVPGSVDNHWGQRIGGALLLALADAGVSMAEATLQNAGRNSNNAQFNFGGGGGANLNGLTQVTNAVLAKTINIPPTVSLNQGDMVTLWITEDIDFSPSYQVKPR
jgi:type IV secretion system protein VirB10